MHFRKITDLILKDKIVFIRTDMNVPIQNGIISDDTRIKASITTIQYALAHGAKVIVATHLGRPTEGACGLDDSVEPIANRLSILIGQKIAIVSNIDTPINFNGQNIVMLENIRCNIGEKNNEQLLGQKYANLCDIFVHDAFASAHRAESSTDSVGYLAKISCAGLLLGSELEALSKALEAPKSPVIAIVGGSKVSTKLTVLNNLADKVDYLIVGGGILNTFLLASGYKIGNSLVEHSLLNEAKHIINKMKIRNGSVPLPQDVIVAKQFSATATATSKPINLLDDDDMILDIGLSFAHSLTDIIKNAGTIIWNGPMGVFEFDNFIHGTKIIANAIANSNAYSLAGGGDTISAINKFNVFDKISYVSTAGGALLEYLEGKTLAAITMLEAKNNE